MQIFDLINSRSPRKVESPKTAKPGSSWISDIQGFPRYWQTDEKLFERQQAVFIWPRYCENLSSYRGKYTIDQAAMKDYQFSIEISDWRSFAFWRDLKVHFTNKTGLRSEGIVCHPLKHRCGGFIERRKKIISNKFIRPLFSVSGIEIADWREFLILTRIQIIFCLKKDYVLGKKTFFINSITVAVASSSEGRKLLEINLSAILSAVILLLREVTDLVYCFSPG